MFLRWFSFKTISWIFQIFLKLFVTFGRVAKLFRVANRIKVCILHNSLILFQTRKGKDGRWFRTCSESINPSSSSSSSIVANSVATAERPDLCSILTSDTSFNQKYKSQWCCFSKCGEMDKKLPKEETEEPRSCHLSQLNRQPAK